MYELDSKTYIEAIEPIKVEEYIPIKKLTRSQRETFEKRELSGKSFKEFVKGIEVLPKQVQGNICYNSNNRFFPVAYLDTANYVYFDILKVDSNYFNKVDLKGYVAQITRIHLECIERGEYESLLRLADAKIKLQLYKDVINKLPEHKRYEFSRTTYVQLEYLLRKYFSTYLYLIDKDKLKEYRKLVLESLKHKPAIDKDILRKNILLTGHIDNNNCVRIYRGVSEGKPTKNKWLPFWTLKKEVAKGLGYKGKYYEGKIHLDYVLDCFEDIIQGYEMFVMPTKVVNITEK